MQGSLKQLYAQARKHQHCGHHQNHDVLQVWDSGHEDDDQFLEGRYEGHNAEDSQQAYLESPNLGLQRSSFVFVLDYVLGLIRT